MENVKLNLDFNFIRRIKDSYIAIKDIVSDTSKFVQSTGLHSRSKPIEKPKDISSIENINFFKTDAISSFIIDYRRKAILEVKFSKMQTCSPK